MPVAVLIGAEGRCGAGACLSPPLKVRAVAGGDGDGDRPLSGVRRILYSMSAAVSTHRHGAHALTLLQDRRARLPCACTYGPYGPVNSISVGVVNS